MGTKTDWENIPLNFLYLELLIIDYLTDQITTIRQLTNNHIKPVFMFLCLFNKCS